MGSSNDKGRLTDPELTCQLKDSLITGVITMAVMSETRRPGLWQDMLSALDRGAQSTSEGTASAFLFQAMVDRLLAEFHAKDRQNC